MKRESVLIIARPWMSLAISALLATSVQAEGLSPSTSPDQTELTVIDAAQPALEIGDTAVDVIEHFGSGHASYYGKRFHGRRTANGEIFSANAITGAHPTLPLPSYVEVTSLATGKTILARVDRRGPMSGLQFVAVSGAAASAPSAASPSVAPSAASASVP